MIVLLIGHFLDAKRVIRHTLMIRHRAVSKFTDRLQITVTETTQQWEVINSRGNDTPGTRTHNIFPSSPLPYRSAKPAGLGDDSSSWGVKLIASLILKRRSRSKQGSVNHNADLGAPVCGRFVYGFLLTFGQTTSIHIDVCCSA